jgi:cobalt transporter subunit CbtB
MEARSISLAAPTSLEHGGLDQASRADALKAAAFALMVGLTLVFTTGFAHPELLHNAAHDWRHGMSFPCH